MLGLSQPMNCNYGPSNDIINTHFGILVGTKINKSNQIDIAMGPSLTLFDTCKVDIQNTLKISWFGWKGVASNLCNIF